MKVTVDLKNIDLRERVSQISRRKLSGNFIIISGRHYASFSYRNGEFQRARYDDIKGKEAMDLILQLGEGLLTIDIIEKEKEKEKLWRIIESLPNLLFCGVIEGGIFTQIILKKETRFSEKEINDFLNYVMVFSQRRKTALREVILVYDYYLLYIERIREGVFSVFLLPSMEDIQLLTVSIRNITTRIHEWMYEESGDGY